MSTAKKPKMKKTDWIFDRVRDTLVKEFHGDRLGWEETMDEGAYSRYLMKASDFDLPQDRLLAKLLGHARNFVIGLGIGRRVTIDHSLEDNFTDGKRLVVALAPLGEKEIPKEERVDIYFGEVLHEGCHLKYTDFKIWETHNSDPIKRVLLNIIEDEHIERRLVDDSPGYSRYIEKIKAYYFDHKYLERIEAMTSGDTTGITILAKLLDTFLRAIRYPKYLTDETIEEFEPFLTEVFPFVVPFAKSTRQAEEQMLIVYEAVRKHYAEEVAKEEERRKEEAKAAEEAMKEAKEKLASMTKEKSEHTTKAEEKGKGAEELRKAADAAESAGMEEEAKKMREKADAMAKEAKEAADKARELGDKIAEELEKFEEAASDAAAAGTPIPGIDKVAGTVAEAFAKAFGRTGDAEVDKRAGHKDSDLKGDFPLTKETKRYLDVEAGRIIIGTERATYFKRAKADRKRYEAAYSDVAHSASVLRKKLILERKDYVRVTKGAREGFLDASRLAEGAQGVSTIYETRALVRTKKASVVLLIDQSGSMSGERIAAAMRVAIMFESALSKMPDIELFVYGHTGDITDGHSTDLLIYREPGYCPKYALGSVTAIAQNRDGTAIVETATRVRKFTDKPAIMFVIADGEPYAGGYGGRAAIDHTRNSVMKTTRMGFLPIQICINASYDPASMFKHFVTFTDLASLPKQIASLMKKEVSKMLQSA